MITPSTSCLTRSLNRLQTKKFRQEAPVSSEKNNGFFDQAEEGSSVAGQRTAAKLIPVLYGLLGVLTLRRIVCGSALSSSYLSACALCHTQAGHQVRVAVFDNSFVTKFLVSVAPFPVFFMVIAFIYFGKSRTDLDRK